MTQSSLLFMMFYLGFGSGAAFLGLLFIGKRHKLFNRPRMWVTRFLIKTAMKTCVMGFCHDHLIEALRGEYDL